MARVAFMGTPHFAVPVLERLADDGHQIAAVVTQPDRPVGRGRKLEMPPVKRAALARNLHVLQPESVNAAAFLAEFAALRPEVGVVAAFGQFLGARLLSLVPRGFLNVHASLLPRYRGASPIAAAILAGEPETGVSIMLINEGLDTGPVLVQQVCPILPDDTAGTLEARLAALGADLLAPTLPGWLSGQIVAQPQDGSQATFAGRVEKDDGRIEWSRSAESLARMTRAYDPWPGAFGFLGDQRVRFWRMRAVHTWHGTEAPGCVLPEYPGLVVATGAGALEIDEVQIAGRARVSGADFRRGQRNLVRFE